MALLSAVETGAISGAGLTSARPVSRFRADLSNETSIDLLPAEAARFGAVYYAGLTDSTLQAALADTLLRDAEVQYVARHARLTLGWSIRPRLSLPLPRRVLAGHLETLTQAKTI
jgi:hypothetical protein